MPLDPQAQAILEQAAVLGLPANHTLSAQEARANSKLRRTDERMLSSVAAQPGGIPAA